MPLANAGARSPLVWQNQGYIFFAFAGKVLSEVRNRVVWGNDRPDTAGACNGGADGGGDGRGGGVFGAVQGSSKDAAHPPHRLPTSELSEQKRTRRVILDFSKVVSLLLCLRDLLSL